LFKRILGYLRPYRGLVAVSLLLLLAVSMLGLAGPYLTKVAIDDYIRIQQYEGLDRIASFTLWCWPERLSASFCNI